MDLDVTILTGDIIERTLETLQEDFLWSRKAEILRKLAFEQNPDSKSDLQRKLSRLEKNYKINFFLKPKLPFNEADSKTLLHLWKCVERKDWPEGVIVDKSTRLDIMVSDLSLFKHKGIGELLEKLSKAEEPDKFNQIINEIEEFGKNFSEMYIQQMWGGE